MHETLRLSTRRRHRPKDERYYISAERVAAPESVRVEGQDFIAYLEPSLLGVRLARLDWTE
ncbi:MAG: hypothetical protein ACRD3C_02735 [Vicinamibacterales bacterium]